MPSPPISTAAPFKEQHMGATQTPVSRQTEKGAAHRYKRQRSRTSASAGKWMDPETPTQTDVKKGKTNIIY